MLNVSAVKNGKLVERASVEQLGSLLEDKEALVWVEITEPTDEDWQTVEREFGFHHLAIEDALKRNQRPKLDEYPDHLFLSVRLWTDFKGTSDTVSDITDEVDIFLGANYIVTSHWQPCSDIVEQRKRWLENPSGAPESAAFLLYMVLDTVVDTFFPAIDELTEEIDTLENQVYAPKKHIDWTDAMLVKKRLLLLRQVVAPTRDALNRLLRAEHALIPAELRIYFSDIYDHTLRQVEQVDLQRDIITGVMEAILAQVNNRLNEVMKTLTVWSIILMVNSMIAGIYGMNFANMPELKTHYGYFVVLGVMACVTGGLLVWFKRIKWI
jgi:magnesium transporter